MESYKFYQNKACEYFPCHADADPDKFNCMFCYCPLYTLGAYCGGNYSYTESGFKDCSLCLIPHNPDNYLWIMAHMDSVMELAKRKEDVSENS